MSESKQNVISFYYSIKFYFVLLIDIIISSLFCLFVLSTMSYAYFGIINFLNLIIDVLLLNNRLKDRNNIDIRLVWIKCIFGFLGIFTILSGLYFGIISLTMQRVYNEERKKKDEEYLRNRTIERNKREKELEDAKFKEIIESIKSLEEAGAIKYIDNYVKKYYNYLQGTSQFNNLKDLLKTKNFDFDNSQLVAIIHYRYIYQNSSELKTKIFHNNPKNADDCIRNFLEINANGYNEIDVQTLQRILIEEFNHYDDVKNDIERVKKEIELKKFETSLISDSDSGVRFTIIDIGNMSGYDFENLLRILFEKMGYKVTHTSLSSDQGADLVIEKFGEKTVIQAKNWTNKVGNSAIQEVVASIKYYDAQRSMVITSSDFTMSAIDFSSVQ